MSLKENLENVEKEIEESIERGNRAKGDVKLIAVSKTKPISDIEEVYALGMRDFGENKVQELCEKEASLPADIRWHLIGHLQTNKVKYIVDKVYMIHSVDSLKLANEINKEAEKKNVDKVKILIELNLGMEETKFGLESEDEILNLVSEISKLPRVEINGLMTVAPYVENIEDNREIFKQMKKISSIIESKHIPNVKMDYLSMGMSNDFTVAIEEGANYVRVGTKIFGERDYSKK